MERRQGRFSYLFIKNCGFTLIEILIGISIFMIIITAIYATLRQGVNVVRKSDEKIALYQELRLVLKDISKDIRNATQLGKERFNGSSTSLSFLTLDTERRRLMKINYKCEDSLLITKSTFGWEETEDLKERYDGITKLNFKYLDLEENWHDTWNDAKLPKAVKISLEVDNRIFTTTVWIPIIN